jgi:endoglucanase
VPPERYGGQERHSMYPRSPVLSRRTLLGGLAAAGSIAPSLADSTSFRDEWCSFKSRFLSADGRIIDTGNRGVSHSEGQGWGLLFAVAAQDRAGFDLMLSWTARVLRRSSDTLHAWRYVPNDRPPVQDINNALDGDMFIAAALSRAGRLWGRPDHLQAAAAVARDILRLLVRPVDRFMVLLPGIDGFERADAVVVNLSYYAFPMMSELAEIVPSRLWDRLQRDGRTLIEQGRFGRWSLPPDWLQIGRENAALAPAPNWPPRFSYDAVRVPLWWIWQKLLIGPAIRSVDQFWAAYGSAPVPAWADLETDRVAPYPASPGIVAIMRLLRLAIGGSEEPSNLVVSDATDYYNAALILLSHLAKAEMARMKGDSRSESLFR